ncbi:MAG: molecular chaperone TorD family protein [Candidatus Rokubacteria bacterium]|nr:molecular chaperone TorD family protein [Candidatus Rokubacteria bacterium]
MATALGRAAVYRLLGGAFVSPTPARLEELALAAATAVTSFKGRLSDKLARFAIAASEADPVATANEHVFLFGRQVRCSPYESAYSGLSPFGDKTARLADVAGFYEAFGVGPAAAQPDMEDHVGAELEFMSALALKEAWALGEGRGEAAQITRGAEVAFLGDHLGRWAEAFAAQVEAATPLPFYTAAASLLTAWIAAEVEALGAAPSRVGAPDALDADAAEPFTCPMAPEEPQA